MKKTINVLMAILVAFTLFSCGGGAKDDPSKAPHERLQGEWKIVKAEGTMASLNEGTTYIFEGENFTMKLGIIETNATFTATDSTYAYKLKDFDSEFSNNYSFEDGQLVIKPVGSDQVFYLEKQ